MSKEKITWSNIKSYIQGNVRMKLYYSSIFRSLLPLHIFEQISFRLLKMNKECYTNGACLQCGCATPALQMANKACLGKCYPEMMDKADWETYKYFNKIEFRYTDLSKREFELRVTNPVFRK